MRQTSPLRMALGCTYWVKITSDGQDQAGWHYELRQPAVLNPSLPACLSHAVSAYLQDAAQDGVKTKVLSRCTSATASYSVRAQALQ